MCGRYSLIADLGELARRFEFDGDWDDFERRYNIAPTQDVLTVVGGESRRGGYMRWGLIPSWAKDKSIGNRMINARAETVGEKPSFRNALRRRRCLVLADGFLRVAETRQAEEAHANRHAVGRAVRLRRTLGDVARPAGRNHPLMRDHHHLRQRHPQPHPRQDARHPPPRPSKTSGSMTPSAIPTRSPAS